MRQASSVKSFHATPPRHPLTHRFAVFRGLICIFGSRFILPTTPHPSYTKLGSSTLQTIRTRHDAIFCVKWFCHSLQLFSLPDCVTSVGYLPVHRGAVCQTLSSLFYLSDNFSYLANPHRFFIRTFFACTTLLPDSNDVMALFPTRWSSFDLSIWSNSFCILVY